MILIPCQVRRDMNEKESHQMKKQSEQKNPLAELADESGLGPGTVP